MKTQSRMPVYYLTVRTQPPDWTHRRPWELSPQRGASPTWGKGAGTRCEGSVSTALSEVCQAMSAGLPSFLQLGRGPTVDLGRLESCGTTEALIITWLYVKETHPETGSFSFPNSIIRIRPPPCESCSVSHAHLNSNSEMLPTWLKWPSWFKLPSDLCA